MNSFKFELKMNGGGKAAFFGYYSSKGRDQGSRRRSRPCLVEFWFSFFILIFFFPSDLVSVPQINIMKFKISTLSQDFSFNFCFWVSGWRRIKILVLCSIQILMFCSGYECRWGLLCSWMLEYWKLGLLFQFHNLTPHHFNVGLASGHHSRLRLKGFGGFKVVGVELA